MHAAPMRSPIELYAFSSDQIVSSVHTWILGAFITFACLLGFREGMRIAFNENLTSIIAEQLTDCS